MEKQYSWLKYIFYVGFWIMLRYLTIWNVYKEWKSPKRECVACSELASSVEETYIYPPPPRGHMTLEQRHAVALFQTKFRRCSNLLCLVGRTYAIAIVA